MKMDANGIVWKQNIHLGDARATDWILEGSIDLGHRHVPNARKRSWEHHRYKTGKGSPLIFMGDLRCNPLFHQPIAQRAFGVIHHR